MKRAAACPVTAIRDASFVFLQSRLPGAVGNGYAGPVFRHEFVAERFHYAASPTSILTTEMECLGEACGD